MEQIRALIVDDEEPLRGIMRIALGYFGIKVVGEAANGEEAVAKYQEVQPNVVLMDINMPKMDGLTALREIIKINPEAIVLLITATDDETAMDKGRDLGARGFLRKPLVMDELHKDILSHLRVQIAKEKGQTLEKDYFKYQIKPGFRPGDEGKHFEAPEMTGATKAIRERQKASETPETHPEYHAAPGDKHTTQDDAKVHPDGNPIYTPDVPPAARSTPAPPPQPPPAAAAPTPPPPPPKPPAPEKAAGMRSGGYSRISGEVADIINRESNRKQDDLEAARAEIARLKKALADAADKLRAVADDLTKASK